MQTIKELAPKPSDALRAIVRGMRRMWPNGRPTFRFDIGTYGEIDNDDNLRKKSIACGCVGNVALQALTGKAFTPRTILRSHNRKLKDIRYGVRGGHWYMGFDEIAHVFGLGDSDTRDFMLAVDRLRRGHVNAFEDFYEVQLPQWAVTKFRKIHFTPDAWHRWPILLRDLSRVAQRLRLEGL